MGLDGIDKRASEGGAFGVYGANVAVEYLARIRARDQGGGQGLRLVLTKASRRSGE